MTFMDDYRAGRADHAGLDQAIAFWHHHVDRCGNGPGLEDWLGMTWAEYIAYALEGKLPPVKVNA